MYYLGLDLGQKRDHSAVAVVERIDHWLAFQSTAFERLNVRYVERMPLGTPYPGIVARIREIVRSDPLYGDCALAVDATGWALLWSTCCGRRGWGVSCRRL